MFVFHRITTSSMWVYPFLIVLSASVIASFAYDSKGLRKTMTTVSGTITFHYDENNNVAYETDSTNAIVASYTWNGIQPVSMTRGGKTYYYQLNGHGDVVALTDGTTGAVVNTYDYDAFGNVVKQTGTVENPYLYAGYRYDKDTGLYYLQARYYNAKVARFLTLDPDLGNENEPLTQNGYNYANNNPVMYIDPDGNYPAVIGVFYIPYVGQVLLLATGVVVMVYITYRAISWIAKKVRALYSKSKKSKASKKQKATDVPSWAKGKRPHHGENGNEFAKRLCDDRFGPGNYKKGPGSDFNKIKKLGD